jgi:hypothetical protein
MKELEETADQAATARPSTKVAFLPIVEWRQYYETDMPMMLGNIAGEQSRLHDDLVIRKLGVARRKQRRQDKLHRGRATQALDMTQTLLAKMGSSMNSDDGKQDDAPSAQMLILEELLKLGLDEGNLRAVLSHFPADMREKLRKETRAVMPTVFDNSTPETEVISRGQQCIADQVDQYQYLAGETFIDDENRRKYTGVNVLWHEEAKCVVVSRAPAKIKTLS